MNTADKLFAAMRANPRDWHLGELQTVANRRGISWRMAGSHCIFKRLDGDALSVPAHRTIKPIYVREFVLFAEAK